MKRKTERSDKWIEQLGLLPHPEGGFYKESYRSAENIGLSGLPGRFSGARSFSTAIYFLLRSQDRSLFHRIKSDEIWHYYAGASLSIYVLENGKLEIKKLGSDSDRQEMLQVVVPANTWFGAKVNEPDSFVLAGCTVAPGFDFQDFEMASRSDLLQSYSMYREIIEMLTA